jgi:hypothetical protein
MMRAASSKSILTVLFRCKHPMTRELERFPPGPPSAVNMPIPLFFA